MEEHNRPGMVVVFTDGSVLRGVKSGWGFIERVGRVVVAEDSGAFAQTTSCMCIVHGGEGHNGGTWLSG